MSGGSCTHVEIQLQRLGKSRKFLWQLENIFLTTRRVSKSDEASLHMFIQEFGQEFDWNKRWYWLFTEILKLSPPLKKNCVPNHHYVILPLELLPFPLLLSQAFSTKLTQSFKKLFLEILDVFSGRFQRKTWKAKFENSFIILIEISIFWGFIFT